MNKITSQLSKLPAELVDQALNPAANFDAKVWLDKAMAHLTYDEFMQLMFADMGKGSMMLSDKLLSFMDGAYADVRLVNGLSYGLYCLLNFATQHSWGELLAMIGVGITTHYGVQYY